MILSEDAQKRISRESVHSNERAYTALCKMEIDLEEKLDIIREVKAYILVDIELKNNGRRES